MNRVVFISSQSPRDGLTGFLAGIALIVAVVGATMAGWQTGGPLLAILYGLVMLITFPFLLTFATILFLAFYPVLAWPGTLIADRLGWTWTSPDAIKRLWLQRLSVVALLVPIFVLLQQNAISVLGLVAGIATFGLVMLGLLVALPVLLLTGLFFYALFQSRTSDGSASTFHWTPPDAPRLPPPK